MNYEHKKPLLLKTKKRLDFLRPTASERAPTHYGSALLFGHSWKSPQAERRAIPERLAEREFAFMPPMVLGSGIVKKRSVLLVAYILAKKIEM